MAVYRAAGAKKGDTLYIGYFSKNTSDVPTAADSTPTFTAYASADLIAQSNGISCTVTAITGVTGGYAISKDTTSMDRGVYHGIISYALSSSARKDMIEFPIG